MEYCWACLLGGYKEFAGIADCTSTTPDLCPGCRAVWIDEVGLTDATEDTVEDAWESYKLEAESDA